MRTPAQVTDNTGLNGNFIKLDTAIGAEHNSNGSHKDDKIEGRSLKAAIVDGVTLEATAATGAKVFRVKDSGITATKLATDSVETAKIKDANVTAVKLAADVIAANGGLEKDINGSIKVKHDSSLQVDGSGNLGMVGGNYNGAIVFSMKNFGENLVTAQNPTNPNMVWSTNQTNDEIKANFSFPKLPGMTKIRVYFIIKTSAAGGTHYFTATASATGWSPAAVVKTGTALLLSSEYSDYAEFDISALSNFVVINVVLFIKSNSGSYTTTVGDVIAVMIS